MLQHRAPAAHDGFQYFTLQYFFLNNAIQSGELAQWIPYMSQGTVATQWYGVQGSVLQNALLPVAPLLQKIDLLTVFHLGMFVDEMILLVGTWLLARRFFQLPAVVFITVSVVGSAVWLDQPYWNVRLYYALPLVLELGHRFLETGRWRWFVLAANLLALQVIGNLPYFVPVATFAVFVYFAGFAASHGAADVGSDPIAAPERAGSGRDLGERRLFRRGLCVPGHRHERAGHLQRRTQPRTAARR